ncbi:ATP-dependent RNA helicase DEAH12, chloroplastic-like [Zingiber officinale]|uniref:ATP-dependent RNA helicase DEAH12, chloroplastic-like n=1 Tax=Zingiber officinale TaxID=94328 RepID=UPI001C4AA19F|nr:ATP-dependent RNA helicase DEAH12, chloroplastic-like [Zingiber officinale]
MEIVNCVEHGLLGNPDAEDEFRSCCTEEEEEWQDTEESLAEGSNDDLEEFSLRMFFKGVSTSDTQGKGSRAAGIGVVMERSAGISLIKVQKKLDFYVEDLVAEHLALMDGISAALRNGTRKLYAFTDSEELYSQIAETEILGHQLLIAALGHRILELAEKLEDFDLQLVSSYELERPLRLAREAIGDWSADICPMCCEEKESSKMIKLNCSHKICPDCMIMYAVRELQCSKVPIKCPQIKCRYLISASECKSFLPSARYELLWTGMIDAQNLDAFFCPFNNCSGVLHPGHCLSSTASSSTQSDINRIQCPECQREMCIGCRVPWHSLMTCEDYQNLTASEGAARDICFTDFAEDTRHRRCQQCRQMIEHTDEGYHVTCWCGHEFCYMCSTEYQNGIQTCHCAFWGENNPEPSVTPSNDGSQLWPWEPLNSLPALTDEYSEQERAQLALVQSFLSVGIDLSELHHSPQSPPRCSDSDTDTVKDLHQLPWLERFVSVISDSYHEDFVQ